MSLVRCVAVIDGKVCGAFHHNDREDGRCDLHLPEPEAPKKKEKDKT